MARRSRASQSVRFTTLRRTSANRLTPEFMLQLHLLFQTQLSMFKRVSLPGAEKCTKCLQQYSKPLQRASLRGNACLKLARPFTTFSRPLPRMSRSDKGEEAFRNTMTGLPHKSSSTKAHASPKKIPVASPSARYIMPSSPSSK